jgi:hypothetical protein
MRIVTQVSGHRAHSNMENYIPMPERFSILHPPIFSLSLSPHILTLAIVCVCGHIY